VHRRPWASTFFLAHRRARFNDGFGDGAPRRLLDRLVEQLRDALQVYA